MDILIGKVVRDVLRQNNECIYVIQTQDKKYSVVSKDYQAVKDKIFINVGQMVEIVGKIEKDTIYTIKSKIILKKDVEKR